MREMIVRRLGCAFLMSILLGFKPCAADDAYSVTSDNTITDEIARSGPGLGGVLGISSQDGIRQLARATIGILAVLAFNQGGGAQNSTLEIGDIVYNIDNFYFSSAYAMRRYLNSRPPGTVVTVYYWRPSANLVSASTTVVIGSFSYLSTQPLGPKSAPPSQASNCRVVDSPSYAYEFKYFLETRRYRPEEACVTAQPAYRTRNEEYCAGRDDSLWSKPFRCMFKEPSCTRVLDGHNYTRECP